MVVSGAMSSKIVEWIFETITPVSPAHKDEGECIISGGTHSGNRRVTMRNLSSALELFSGTLHIVHEDSHTAIFMHDACKDV